jgi:YbbR domain-containing protein
MDWMYHYLAAIKEYAKDYVLENTGLKVLALLITAVLWLSVASRPLGQIVLNGVPIQFYPVPEATSLTASKTDTLTARVYLEGPGDVLEGLRGGQLYVTADMSNVEPGVRVIPLKIEGSRLPPNVRVKEIDPPTIRVTVERVVEKELPIIPRFDGEPSQGYQVIDWQIVPATVKISGAESQMKEITEVSTETVRLTNKTEPFSSQVAIDIGSPNLSIINDNARKVMLTVNIGEARQERAIANVSVGLFGAPGRARPVPRFVKVTVYGPRSAVDQMNAADVNAAVQYEKGSREFTPKVTLSPAFADRVEVRAVEPRRVQVR